MGSPETEGNPYLRTALLTRGSCVFGGWGRLIRTSPSFPAGCDLLLRNSYSPLLLGCPGLGLRASRRMVPGSVLLYIVGTDGMRY